MSVLDGFPFEASIATWGAQWWGQIGERTALLVEGGPIVWPMWDDTKADLDSQILLCPDGVSRPPDRWALPWVTTWLMRQTAVHSDSTE